MNRIKPNFVYILSLTRSTLVLLIVIFRKFAAELRPLIDVKIQILFNILRIDGQNLSKSCIHIIIYKIYVGIVNRFFLLHKFATELRTLIDIRIQSLFNIFRMNGQNLTKFCIHIIIDKIYVGIVKDTFLQSCITVTEYIFVL